MKESPSTTFVTKSNLVISFLTVIGRFLSGMHNLKTCTLVWSDKQRSALTWQYQLLPSSADLLPHPLPWQHTEVSCMAAERQAQPTPPQHHTHDQAGKKMHLMR